MNILEIDIAKIIRVNKDRIQKALPSRIPLANTTEKRPRKHLGKSVGDRSALSLIDFGRGNEHVMHPKLGDGQNVKGRSFFFNGVAL